MTCPGIYPQIYYRTPTFQYLFVRGSNKKQTSILNFTKEEIFFISYNNQVLLGVNLTIQPLFLHPPEKAFLSPSVWPRKYYTWTLISKKSLLICFENCQGITYSHRQRRKRMVNTLLMVNITSICKRFRV